MTKNELKEVTKFLMYVLNENGYTEKDSGDILEAAGQFIKEVRYEKSSKNNSEANARLRIYDERLSTL